MGERRAYRKRAERYVVAVQVRLNLGDGHFQYVKWGGIQTCKQGDWIVDNQGDVYSVDHVTFVSTYCSQGGGRYVKTSPVWAEVSEEAGSIRTKEGVTHYDKGAYLVFNDPHGHDGYAVEAATFKGLYEPVDGDA